MRILFHLGRLSLPKPYIKTANVPLPDPIQLNSTSSEHVQNSTTGRKLANFSRVEFPLPERSFDPTQLNSTASWVELSWVASGSGDRALVTLTLSVAILDNVRTYLNASYRWASYRHAYDQFYSILDQLYATDRQQLAHKTLKDFFEGHALK